MVPVPIYSSPCWLLIPTKPFPRLSDPNPIYPFWNILPIRLHPISYDPWPLSFGWRPGEPGRWWLAVLLFQELGLVISEDRPVPVIRIAVRAMRAGNFPPVRRLIHRRYICKAETWASLCAHHFLSGHAVVSVRWCRYRLAICTNPINIMDRTIASMDRTMNYGNVSRHRIE